MLASKPEDLRDGEVICELAAMLLGPQSVPQPGDRVGTGVSDEYADAERLELALEALAKHADLPLGGNKDRGTASTATSPGGLPRRRVDRTEMLVAVSATAARIARGDLPATVHVLDFMRDALGGESRGVPHEPSPAPSAKGTRALEALSRSIPASPVASGPHPASNVLSRFARNSNVSPSKTRPEFPASPPRSFRQGTTASPEGSLSEWAADTPKGQQPRVGQYAADRSYPDTAERSHPRDEDAVREAARSAAEKINVADADAETAPPETKNKGALERNVYGYAFEGHGGSPVAAYAAGYPTSGEAAQAWSGKMSIVDLNPNQQSLVVWLVSLGLDVTGAEVVEGKDGGCEITRLPKAAHVQAEAAKGILLGDLVCLLEGAFMGGMIQRPKVKEECMHNINKALAALRRGGVTNARYLWSAAEIAKGDAEVVWGLLHDIKLAYKGFPARRERCVVSRRVDTRLAGNKSPTADGGSLRSGTKTGTKSRSTKSRSSAPAAELSFDTDVSGLDWRRARPGTTLKDRGVPSPLADAAQRVSATRRGFSFSNGPARPLSRTARRSPMGDRSPNVDKSRLKHPRRSEDDLKKRPAFTNSGYVSPNEGGDARRRATSAPRFRDKSPAPMMGSPHGIHSNNSPHSTRARSVSPRPARAAPRPGEDPPAPDYRAYSPRAAAGGPASARHFKSPNRARPAKSPIRRRTKVDTLAEKAARAAAKDGNVPVVFEYREGPPPPMPPARQRDDEVREWLRSLRLGVLAREEAADLLNNPLRNGVLLSDLMTVLVGAPPLGRRDRCPRTLAVARANVERALVPLRTMPGPIPPNLTWSTEGMLKGMRENIFGLLWYVKHAIPEQRSYSRGAAPADWKARNPADPPSVQRLRFESAAAEGTDDRESSPRGDEVAVTGGSPVVGVVKGSPAHDAKLGSDPTRTSSKYQFVPVPAVGAPKSVQKFPKNGTASKGFNKTDERGRALNGYEALAYSDASIERLESSITRWLHEMKLLDAERLRCAFAALCPEMSTGILLCDLVAAIEGVPVIGVFRPPKSHGTKIANVRRACERLARHRFMSKRFLFNHDDVAAGVPGVVLGLLEDVRVFYDGHPPRTSQQYWDPETPYMPEIGMGRPAPPLPPPPPPDASPHRVLERFGHLENGEVSRDDFEDPEEEPSNGWGYHPKPAPVDDDDAADPTKTPPRSERPVRLGASIMAKSAEEKAEAAVRAAAAEALSGWQEKLAEDMDRPGAGGLHPTVPFKPTRIGEVPRDNTWEASSFPRRRVSVPEVERNLAAESAAAAAESVAEHYNNDARRPERPSTPRKSVAEKAAATKRRILAANKTAVNAGFTSATAARASSAGKRREGEEPAPGRRWYTASQEPPSPPPPRRSATSHRSPIASVYRPPTAAPPPATAPPLRQAHFFDETPQPRSGASTKSPTAERMRKFQERHGRRKGERVSFEQTPPRSVTPDRARPGSANYLRRSSPPSDHDEKDGNGWTADDREAVRLARWIDGLGVSLRRADGATTDRTSEFEAEFTRHKSRPAAELAAACSDGTLLCELVRLLERKELTGVTWQPRAGAARLHNVGKAMEALRNQPAMSPMHLWSDKDIVSRDVGTVLGLLSDMHACTAYRGRRTVPA